jgi:hypothetical protein
MYYTDRHLIDAIIALIGSCYHLNEKLLDEEIELMCVEQVVNIAQLAALGRARDLFKATAVAMDCLRITAPPVD